MRIALVTLAVLLLAGFALGGEVARKPSPITFEKEPEPRPEDAPWPKPLGDPRRAEVRLPAAEGWRASLVHDNRGVGIWTVKCFQVFEQLACPELVALDDLGRLWVHVVYSGKWTPLSCVDDGWWLGGLVQADLDPRAEGKELYAGSLKGRLWQVVPHAHGAFESRLVHRFEGREIHTLVAGELDPEQPGPELLVFTNPGGLYLVKHERDGFAVRHLEDLPGRVRDAVVLERGEGLAPDIATVSRAGRLRLLRLENGKTRWTQVYAAPMGLGRIAARPIAGVPVLYATRDDGVILRAAQGEKGWATEAIYLGPQGPRGIVADVFAGPDDETVAVYGYSKRVELLTKTKDGWKVETLFKDLDAGHWLAAAEVDGRNATRELAACGFGGRVVVLGRAPGYGLKALAAEDE